MTDTLNKDHNSPTKVVVIPIKLSLLSWEVGISGESEPLVIIDTTDLSSILDMNDTSDKGNCLNEFQNLWCGSIQDDDRFEWYLFRLFDHLFNDQFPIDFEKANDRADYQLLIIFENEGMSEKLKSIIKTVLFEMGCSNVTFIDSSLMVCVASGVTNGLVIDLSWTKTTVIPIYDMRILSPYVRSTNRSLQLVHRLLNQNNTGSQRTIDDVISHVDRYDDSDDGVINEVYFQPEECWNMNDLNENALIQMISEIYLALPIDSRKSILQNIVFVTPSNNDQFGNLKLNLLAEIRNTVCQDARAVQSLGSWCGGSLYTSTSYK